MKRAMRQLMADIRTYLAFWDAAREPAQHEVVDPFITPATHEWHSYWARRRWMQGML